MINPFSELLVELCHRVDPMMTDLDHDLTLHPSAGLADLKALRSQLDPNQEPVLLFAQKLVLIQHFLSQQLEQLHEDNNYVILVRFYVDNTHQTDIHPGINSWGYQDWHKQQAKGEGKQQVLLPDKEQERIAQEHMYYGHDVESKEKVTMNSPFISTTWNVAALLAADSPFNTDRGLSMMGNEYAVMKKGNVQPSKDLRKAIAQKKPESRQPAMHVSDKIVTLIYGHSNATIAELAKKQKEEVNAEKKGELEKKGRRDMGCVANRIAFLLVDKRLVVLPQPGTNPKACCMLEAEAVIYAPQINVSAWVIAQIHNELPQLAGRFQDL